MLQAVGDILQTLLGIGLEVGEVNTLQMALRLQGQVTDLQKVQLAYRERNGRISVITQPSEPQVVIVPVEEGVQTVRIELNG